MKVVAQRVTEASVSVDGQIIGKIGKGLLLLVGIAKEDTRKDIDFVADKCINLRIFQDEHGKMNRSVIEENGEILAISQFTLLGNTQRGRRPSFIDAADPEKGEELYAYFVQQIMRSGLNVRTGRFGAMMDVALVNAGPVTIIVESK